MQPLGAKRRPIRRPLRAGPTLAYERLSDPILITRAKDGDERALEALCARHEPAAARLARRLLRDPEDARDATQEALAKVCARLRQFRGEAAFTTWLHRLVANACHDVAARRTRWEPLPEDVRTESPAADLGDADELRACLLELPPAQARVVVLRHAFGYSFAEIAKATAMPVGTAKCYAHRARKALRLRLESVA